MPRPESLSQPAMPVRGPFPAVRASRAAASRAAAALLASLLAVPPAARAQAGASDPAGTRPPVMDLQKARGEDAPGAPGALMATPALTLSQAIREAMTRSEEAQLLKESENNVVARKREVWAEGLPRITATANVGRGNVVMDPSSFPIPEDTSAGAQAGPAIFSFTQTRYAYAVEAQQSLFSFGRLTQAVRAANAQEKSEAFDRRRSLQQLQLRTLDAYYGVVTSRARLRTLESSVKRSRETVAFLESNFRMGAGLRANVLRAITALKAQEPERIRAERDAEAARMNLNRLLGRPVDAPMELDTTDVLPMPPVAEVPGMEALEGVVDARPDVRAMGLARQSLEGRARYIKMLYLPSLGATGRIGVTAFDPDQLAEFDQNKEWQVGIGLNWSLFDGGANLARAQQIRSQARSLRLNESIARKSALVEIESAYRDYRAADTALAAADQAVQAAREAQAMVSEDFRAGKGQITDLLETEDVLRQTEFGVLAARYQRVRSQAALRLALGNGLINEEAR